MRGIVTDEQRSQAAKVAAKPDSIRWTDYSATFFLPDPPAATMCIAATVFFAYLSPSQRCPEKRSQTLVLLRCLCNLSTF